jgi:transcriptional regulator with GAF, ATPase, and Fis domain
MADGKLERERDLYRRLLDLDAQRELSPLLQEALALIVDVTGARLGYLELHDEENGADGPRWSAAHGMTEEEVADARAVMSRGIVAEALATGQTIVTPSALLDPRFQERRSVQVGGIEAVLCTPIGGQTPVGVLYLQASSGGGPFSDDDSSTAELFGRHLAPLADRLLVRVRMGSDPTVALREKLRLDGVVGKSSALAELLRQVALVAPLDVSVLLTGESGTGKSQIARVIHDNGRRAAHPFVALNCAALPEALIESELFGSLPGAHSTATRKVEGKVAAAEGGTLFLDEVGDLSLPAQAKVLQLLHSREYYPLGAPKAVHADVRILAATNVDLQAAVAERRFRQDLLYRLQVLPVYVPSLAQRREDVAPLAAFFCAEACLRHGLPKLEISYVAQRAIESTEWPGNVRQLAHAIEAGAIRAAGAGAKRIERGHVFVDAAAGLAIGDDLTFQAATRQFQAGFLRDVLEESDWNVAEVAQRLDLARSHVYNLIKGLGLERR